jgi:AAA+ ATPase superfamily predicted ATPase
MEYAKIKCKRRKLEMEKKPFFGRNEELASLAELWEKPTPSLVICRGRRRIGKSTLFKKFAKESKARFIELEGIAPEPGMDNQDQLDAFMRQLSEQSGAPFSRVDNWYDAFKMLDRELGGKRRKVVLLDEISWLGHYEPGFAGQLKAAWDRRFHERSNLVVAVCGSVSSWIADNILNNTGFVGRISRDVVLGELPLRDAVKFWGAAAERRSAQDLLDVFSVTGGVPRYLEEVRPSLPALENIRRMCFLPDGTLFKDFKRIFADVFGEKAKLKRRILQTLADGTLGGAEIAKALGMERGGTITAELSELELAGFVAKDSGLNPETLEKTRNVLYRLSDNYTRFYLQYVEPREAEIEGRKFKFATLESLPRWSTILGLQFENLVISNFDRMQTLLGVRGVEILSAAPWRKNGRKKDAGVQIDLLVQTPKSVYVVEIKRRNRIGDEVIEDVRGKLTRIRFKGGKSIRTVLVYCGELAPTVRGSGFFDFLISGEDLLK